MTVGMLLAAMLALTPVAVAIIGAGQRQPGQWWAAWTVIAVLCVAVDAVVISQLAA